MLRTAQSVHVAKRYNPQDTYAKSLFHEPLGSMSSLSVAVTLRPDDTLATPQHTMSDWEREIAAMIIETLGLDIDVAAFVPDAPLYGGGLGLDSIDMLEIATVISQKYAVEIRSDDAKNEQIFASLRALADYVARHRSS